MNEDNQIKYEPLGNGFFICVSRQHTFGTDAVLLNAFSLHKKSDKVCDIGTGCGIIPLLMCRESPPESVFGVEIQEDACRLAEMSVTKNDLHSKIKIINSDIKDFQNGCYRSYFNLITCNPPYKADGAGIKNNDEAKIIARHETMCGFSDIAASAAVLLKTSGRFCVCHRPERLADIICEMRKNKIEPKRLRTVSKKEGCEPWLVLVEGRKCSNPGMRIMPPLFVYNNNGEYSEEMLKIYGKYKENHNVGEALCGRDADR